MVHHDGSSAECSRRNARCCPASRAAGNAGAGWCWSCGRTISVGYSQHSVSHYAVSQRIQTKPRLLHRQQSSQFKSDLGAGFSGYRTPHTRFKPQPHTPLATHTHASIGWLAARECMLRACVLSRLPAPRCHNAHQHFLFEHVCMFVCL